MRFHDAERAREKLEREEAEWRKDLLVVVSQRDMLIKDEEDARMETEEVRREEEKKRAKMREEMEAASREEAEQREKLMEEMEEIKREEMEKRNQLKTKMQEAMREVEMKKEKLAEEMERIIMEREQLKEEAERKMREENFVEAKDFEAAFRAEKQERERRDIENELETLRMEDERRRNELARVEKEMEEKVGEMEEISGKVTEEREKMKEEMREKMREIKMFIVNTLLVDETEEEEMVMEDEEGGDEGDAEVEPEQQIRRALREARARVEELRYLADKRQTTVKAENEQTMRGKMIDNEEADILEETDESDLNSEEAEGDSAEKWRVELEAAKAKLKSVEEEANKRINLLEVAMGKSQKVHEEEKRMLR